MDQEKKEKALEFARRAKVFTKHFVLSSAVLSVFHGVVFFIGIIDGHSACASVVFLSAASAWEAICREIERLEGRS